MLDNILVNSHMEIDDRNEGSLVSCAIGMGGSTEGPNRWFSQLLGEATEVEMKRILGSGPAGTHAFCRLRVIRPAKRIVGLDRLQLFQPIARDELYGLASGEAEHKEAGVPLRMALSIRTNLDFDLGITLNSGATDRNFTTMRPVVAGSWQRIVVDLPGDDAAPWKSDGRIGLYFQLGLSCGETRLSQIDGQWNEGHFLMIAGHRNERFLTTEGATAEITACYFGPQGADDGAREPVSIGRLRAHRYLEKSYYPGTRPGTPNVVDGSLEIAGTGGMATGRAYFKTVKDQTQKTKLYSPTSGAPEMAWNVTAGGEVPVGVIEQGPHYMVIGIPNSRAGHAYRTHWMAHDL